MQAKKHASPDPEIAAMYYQLTARGATPKARNRALMLSRLEEEQAAEIARKQQRTDATLRRAETK